MGFNFFFPCGAWQVDLGQDKMVSGVVIQGGKHRERNVFMKKFRVGHSLDGEDWTIIKEDNTTKPKVGAPQNFHQQSFCLILKDVCFVYRWFLREGCVESISPTL